MPGKLPDVRVVPSRDVPGRECARRRHRDGQPVIIGETAGDIDRFQPDLDPAIRLDRERLGLRHEALHVDPQGRLSFGRQPEQVFDPIRSDLRYRRLLRKMNLDP